MEKSDVYNMRAVPLMRKINIDKNTNISLTKVDIERNKEEYIY